MGSISLGSGMRFSASWTKATNGVTSKAVGVIKLGNFYNINLEQFVATDHPFRKIRTLIDVDRIRKLCAPFTKSPHARIAFAGYFENLVSKSDLLFRPLLICFCEFEGLTPVVCAAGVVKASISQDEISLTVDLPMVSSPVIIFP